MTPELVLARGSRTFSLASRLLPRDRRHDAAVVYAFCRLVDDLADDAGDREGLDRLDADLAAGRSDRAGAFLEVAERRGIALDWPRALVAGCRSDVGRVRLADDDALVRYAWQVAGTVGLMCCAVLGAPPEARPYAEALGIGMQITNVCRDVAEDAARDRVYLPADRLRRAGVDPERPVDPRTATVVVDLLDVADGWYRTARAGYRLLPWRVRPAIRVAANLYRGIGTVLRRRGGRVDLGRAVVPAGAKGGIVALTLAGLA